MSAYEQLAEAEVVDGEGEEVEQGENAAQQEEEDEQDDQEQQQDSAEASPQPTTAVSEAKPAEPTEEELGRRAEEAAAAEEAREQAELRAAQEAEAARQAAAAKLAADIARRRRVDEEELQLVESASAPLRGWLLANVLPALMDGLQQTVKERPEDPIDFLATYLYKYAVDSGELERSKASTADNDSVNSGITTA